MPKESILNCRAWYIRESERFEGIIVEDLQTHVRMHFPRDSKHVYRTGDFAESLPKQSPRARVEII